MTKDEALKLALEALEGVLDDSPKVLEASISGGLYEVVQCRDAITAIKAALEAKDEPMHPDIKKLYEDYFDKCFRESSSPQRTWVGLTNDEIKEIVGPYGDTPIKGYTRKLFDQIETALRSKNT